jgi:2-polyprenyl-3-methyl-5-hydroxy-6-metoxy-1,4-benzoquinol methylase
VSGAAAGATNLLAGRRPCRSLAAAAVRVYASSIMSRFQLENLRNLLFDNRAERWDQMYQEGQWDFLDSRDQRIRHHVIAGMITDRFSKRADVLDVGCGLGTLLRALDVSDGSYLGLDASPAAIERCKAEFKDAPNLGFEAGIFEAFRTERKFDVVVLNEFLYYLPLRAAQPTLRAAFDLLKGERAVVIVSMNKNPRAWWLRKVLRSYRACQQEVRVTNLQSGSAWTVQTFASDEGERRLRPGA